MPTRLIRRWRLLDAVCLLKTAEKARHCLYMRDVVVECGNSVARLQELWINGHFYPRCQHEIKILDVLPINMNTVKKSNDSLQTKTTLLGGF